MSSRDCSPSVRDDLGRNLEITIRIAPDGRVYFHDIPPDMIGVARAIDPRNPDLRLREQAAQQLLSRRDERQA